MKLADWNCKRCGAPMPDKSPWYMPDSYIYCPKCGAKHIVNQEPIQYITHEEERPHLRWVDNNPQTTAVE